MEDFAFKSDREKEGTAISEINKFVYNNAPHLQEGRKKIDVLIDDLEKKCKNFSIEQRWNALAKMKQEREKRIEKFSRPPIDLRNELELIDRILDKWHSGGGV